MSHVDDDVQTFLDNVSTHDFAVGTEDLQDAYQCLATKTDDFSRVTPGSLAEAIQADRSVVRDVLRLSARFYSVDSWTNELTEELSLENSSKPAVFNEIQRKIDQDPLRSNFFDFMTDILDGDLRGGRNEFDHWDVVEARYTVGTGSALRGQASGNWLEDKIQDDVLEQLGLSEDEDFVHVQGRANVTVGDDTFAFAKGPDFVLPDLNNAQVLIEAKAYVSSTGSKQTDVLGDISKLKPVVSRGVPLYMVLDGPMWRRRQSDLKEVFKRREDGIVAGIYQVETLDQLKSELTQFTNSNDVDE